MFTYSCLLSTSDVNTWFYYFVFFTYGFMGVEPVKGNVNKSSGGYLSKEANNLSFPALMKTHTPCEYN